MSYTSPNWDSSEKNTQLCPCCAFPIRSLFSLDKRNLLHEQPDAFWQKISDWKSQ